MLKSLYRTTVEIWTDHEPQVELSDLAREAESGDALVGLMRTEFVENPKDDPNFPDTEFFDSEDEHYEFTLATPMPFEEAADALTSGTPIRVQHGPFWAEAKRVPHMGYEVMTDDGQLTPEKGYVDGAGTGWSKQFPTPEEAMTAMEEHLDVSRGA